MKRILALVFIAFLILLSPASGFAEKLQYVYSDKDYKYYIWEPPHIKDMGTWFKFEWRLEPIGDESIREFRKSVGDDPGYIITTLGVHKKTPRMEGIKAVFYGINGTTCTIENDFGQGISMPIPRNDPMYLVWEWATKRKHK